MTFVCQNTLVIYCSIMLSNGPLLGSLVFQVLLHESQDLPEAKGMVTLHCAVHFL